ncbi:MAG TPA: hypothetical protein VLF79_01115 [Candidatus Saccharimonadales bacterium]|nr:hypothetical protein [Candidatus Saccharimonadales bacterium]
MKLTYQTAVATLIQFIVVSLFILISQLGSSIIGCFKSSSGECVTNLLTSIIFFLLASVSFGFIWLIGFAAQNRRSKRLSQLLICIESAIALLALFSIKLNSHSRNVSGLIASFGVLVMSSWIITLAFRLMRAGGGRVVVRSRARVRHR